MRHENRIKKVLIDKDALNYSKTSEILERLGNIPAEQIEGLKPFDNKLPVEKEILRLMPFKGKFLKKCPGTKGYICCGYKILNIGTNCPLDCSYCILQSYFNQPHLRVFVNLKDELAHIGEIIDHEKDRIFRIGTGEFTDSLALDNITGWSKTLSVFLNERKNAIIELKTKTDNIQGLISMKHRDRFVISWSLNSPHISVREEHGAPGIVRRLEAAKVCQKEGFIVGFHFDPIIRHKNWKNEYMKTIELMDKYVNPKQIIWTSMGCLRFMPSLKSLIRKRHKDTEILNAEFVRGLDGKMRYFKPVRIECYSFMRENLAKWSEEIGLYLCMESDEIWEKSLGWSPVSSEGLAKYLDRRVKMLFYL